MSLIKAVRRVLTRSYLLEKRATVAAMRPIRGWHADLAWLLAEPRLPTLAQAARDLERGAP